MCFRQVEPGQASTAGGGHRRPTCRAVPLPVWSSSQGREIANLHVKLSYREGGEDSQDIPVQLGKKQNKRGKSLKRVTKDGSNDKGRAGVLSSEEGRKTQRVTFSEGEIAPRPLSSSNFSPLSGIASMNTPIADSLITDLLNQVRQAG